MFHGDLEQSLTRFDTGIASHRTAPVSPDILSIRPANVSDERKVTLRESDERFDAWMREHTAVEFLLYFLVTGLTATGAHLLVSNRQIPYSLAIGATLGLTVATVMTFVDAP